MFKLITIINVQYIKLVKEKARFPLQGIQQILLWVSKCQAINLSLIGFKGE